MAPPPRRGEEEGDGRESAAALRAPAHVMARVFSQLDCVDLLSCTLVCNHQAMVPRFCGAQRGVEKGVPGCLEPVRIVRNV
ncbi:uncharacterized protein LOC133901233 isoform X2 [Phragmites australis]|uniref:uncharacterized protein LOC133901233 isoform X2 n=1 Tax=Phragmites australis TaxID=29695 RepID=UPI002D797469|nr:uncharacterized protein LOC133901233 isoform X2 [Phragmites australis]